MVSYSLQFILRYIKTHPWLFVLSLLIEGIFFLTILVLFYHFTLMAIPGFQFAMEDIALQAESMQSPDLLSKDPLDIEVMQTDIVESALGDVLLALRSLLISLALAFILFRSTLFALSFAIHSRPFLPHLWRCFLLHALFAPLFVLCALWASSIATESFISARESFTPFIAPFLLILLLHLLLTLLCALDFSLSKPWASRPPFRKLVFAALAYCLFALPSLALLITPFAIEGIGAWGFFLVLLAFLLMFIGRISQIEILKNS